MMRSAVVVLAGMQVLAASVWAADYYVLVKGSDANPGTLQKPFASIQKAASMMKGGDTCWVRGGRYFETDSGQLRHD